ncbi:MAG: hypothetical protein ACE15F_25155 [bacterium]
MKKNRLCIYLSTMLVCFFVPLTTQSQDVFKNITDHVPGDLMVVYQQIPSNSQEIDNLTIRLLHSKVDPRNATECIQALPALTKTSYFREMSGLKRGNKFANFIFYFEDIFSPVNPSLYLEICSTLKNTKEDHLLIYYLVNQSLRKSSIIERDKYISKISELVPLDRVMNSLIISSLYEHLGEEKCFALIDQWKNKYINNSSFLQEIEESKKQLLYNKYHKNERDSNKNERFIP